MSRTLVLAEIAGGRLKKATLSALRCAQAIGRPYDVLVLGAGVGPAAEELRGFGAATVRVGDDPALEHYVGERYAPVVAAVAQQAGCDVVVMTATSFGKDLAPRVAQRLEAGLASDIARVDASGGRLVYTRPMYAGNALGTLEVTTPVQVVTVRQSEFEAASPVGGTSPVEPVAVVADPLAGRVEFLGFDEVRSERPELTEAKIIVSGGRALKSGDNFKNVLEPLVDLLGAGMGATRAAVDAGYVPNDLQIGQTGKVVAPQLYIAAGISGAIQHLAGMKNSRTIVAINKDPEAPIFQVADYGLVADLFQAIPELTEEIRRVRSER